MVKVKGVYTVVCRYFTRDGIVEVDLYEVLKRLHIKPYTNTQHGKIFHYEEFVSSQVFAGHAVEYSIKFVLRNMDIINEETKYFYSYHSPYSIMYDCRYDLKDVANMNNRQIDIRLSMTEETFNRVFR